MDNIILEHISVDTNTVYYKFSVSGALGSYFTTDTLVLKYGYDMADIPPSILSIPFISCLIAITWLTDSVMWVQETDRTFYRSVRNLKNAYQELYPDYKFGGRFVSARLTDNKLSEFDKAKALLLFSGGVDAHTTYIRNIDKHPLLCNIQGWYEDIDSYNAAAEADIRDIGSFATQNGLSSTFIKSNFATIIDQKHFRKHIARRLGDSWWHGFQHSMAFISIAIPIAYKFNIPEILIASSFTIGDSRVCASYATTDIEFQFAESGRTIHDGFELTRQDKIKILVEHQKISGKPYPIRVCSFNDHNCCRCEKCFRTIAGIVAENGDIKQFDFNIDEPLDKFFADVMRKNIALFGVKNESITHWPHIRKRMKDNYEFLIDKSFADWFLHYDFVTNKRKAVMKYYFKNFFSILKRKLYK